MVILTEFHFSFSQINRVIKLDSFLNSYRFFA